MQQYDYDDLHALALKQIEEYQLLTITDLIDMLPIARSTFYDKKLDKSNDIKKAFEVNRIGIKSQLRRQWLEPTAKPLVQIALYKLAANQDELQRLTSSRHELTGKDGKDLVEKPDLSKLTDNELEQLEQLTKKTKR